MRDGRFGLKQFWSYNKVRSELKQKSQKKSLSVGEGNKFYEGVEKKRAKRKILAIHKAQKEG